MANHIIQAYGSEAFLTALERAKALGSGGYVHASEEWEQIAKLISEIETASTLTRLLDRADPHTL